MPNSEKTHRRVNLQKIDVDNHTKKEQPHDHRKKHDEEELFKKLQAQDHEKKYHEEYQYKKAQAADFEKKIDESEKKNDSSEKKHDVEELIKKEQTHDHEFLGSTRLAQLKFDPHNHRFSGISGPEIKVEGGHVHIVRTRTDFFDHYHVFEETSSLQIPVGDCKHVHFVEATTSVDDRHCHKLIFSTLIDAPIFVEKA